MSRTVFGGDPASVTTDARGNVKPGVAVTVWSAKTAGTQYTDLLDANGAAIVGGQVVSDAYGIIEFSGPDAITTCYIDSGSGRRLKMGGVGGGGGGDVAAHEADTTNIHGITDTAALATTAQLTAHEADTTAVHGIANTALLATTTQLSSHEADTTGIHGITDTAALLTTTTGVAKSTVTTKGDLIVRDTTGPTRLGVGTNGQVLTADSTGGGGTVGVKWATPAATSAIPPTIVDAKGDIIAATGADTVARLAVGTTAGDVLKVNSATATGLEWGSIPSDAAKANVAGSVRQFADVSDGDPLDGDILRYDDGTGAYIPTDMAASFAALDGAGRIVSTAEPEFYVPARVLNEGASIPAGTPTGCLIFRRPVTATITPVYIGEDHSEAATTCVVTTSQDIDVDDYLLIGFFASGEAPSPTTFPSVTIGGGTGAIGAVTSRLKLQGTTAQAGILIAKCTTAIPAGRTITVTVDDSRAEMGVTMAKSAALASAAFDAEGQGGATSTSPSATSTTTGQAQELGLFMVCFNPSPTDERTIAGTNGWAAVGPTVLSHGASDRAGAFFYKELSAVGAITATATINNGTSGSNSVWASQIITMKAL